jgi:hypothetical protein
VKNTNDLDTDELGNLVDVVALTGNADEERDRVEEVSQNELQGQALVDVQVVAPPGEQGVDQGNQRNDTHLRGHDHSCDLQTEPDSIGERVKGVGCLLGVVFGYGNVTSSERLLGLRIAKFGNGEGGRDRHDAGGDKGLRVDIHGKISHENGAGNGSESYR